MRIVSANRRIFFPPSTRSETMRVLETAVRPGSITRVKENTALNAGSSQQGKARRASVASNWVAARTRGASAQPGAAACTDPWSPSKQLSSHRCLNLDPLGSSHEQDCRQPHEETVLDHPGNPVQKDLEAGGILDPVHMKVQEIMPALRLEDVSPPLPKDSLTTQFLNPACGASPPEPHYLDRQRHRMTQDRSPLGVIHQ